MRAIPARLTALAVAVLAAGALAACGGSSSPSSNSSSGASSGKPVYGGTLNIVAAGGPDHIDTVSAYYTADYMLERAYTRRMLDYPYAVDKKIGDAGWKALTTPEADMATEVPSEWTGYR